MSAEFDKLDTHYRLQLSALMDGALAPDEARFLLRRMQHDEELSGCWERWQLCGDVLRGQAQAAAPAGFAARVALALAAEPAGGLREAASVAGQGSRGRGRLTRWGGGALAASFALVALFMARQQLDDDLAQAPMPVATSQAPEPAIAESTSADASTATSADAVATLAAATVAVASAPRRQEANRGSATRNQQAARSAAARVSREPLRAVATATPAPVADTPVLAAAPPVVNPFAPAAPVALPQTRPWPRSTLPQYSASGAFTAGFSGEQSARAFYPFEPLLPAPAPAPAGEPQD
jgi:negative regulator of sigma E activity